MQFDSALHMMLGGKEKRIKRNTQDILKQKIFTCACSCHHNHFAVEAQFLHFSSNL